MKGWWPVFTAWEAAEQLCHLTYLEDIEKKVEKHLANVPTALYCVWVCTCMCMYMYIYMYMYVYVYILILICACMYVGRQAGRQAGRYVGM